MMTEADVIRGKPEREWRYWLGVTGQPMSLVTREEFICAERAAGFRSQYGPDHPATAGFSTGTICGRKEYWSPALKRWVQG
jgi:hypothetical protein